MTAQSTLTIGILGGTFDPIHNGHLHIALQAQQTLPLHEVQLLPCYQPIHKRSALASAKARVALLQLALQAQPTLSINLTEIQHQCACYTVDTLRELYTPNQSICFLIGMDAWLNLTSWDRWSQLTDYAHLVVCARPGYTQQSAYADDIATWLSSRLTDNPMALTRTVSSSQPGHVLFHSMTDYPIAASTLRQRIHAGEDCQQHLPSAVWGYILDHHLYHHK